MTATDAAFQELRVAGTPLHLSRDYQADDQVYAWIEANPGQATK